MPRIPVVAGNWKMNLDAAGARTLASDIVAGLNGLDDRLEAILCPPFPYLDLTAQAVEESSLEVGAQDVYWAANGAFTGAVSAAMVRDFANYVIIGHSERRALFGESDEAVNRKLGAALAADLIPIVCVGETADEHNAGRTLDVLGRQTRAALANLNVPSTAIVAYEPVWAIGTGQAATAAEASDAIAHIRGEIGAVLGSETADAVRILYGGSVSLANIAEFVSQSEIDGALVGGASLKADSFLGMLEAIAALPQS